jgi:hypothetical protein
MRRGQDDEINRPIGKHLLEFRGEADPMFIGNSPMGLAMSHRLRDTDDVRAAQLTENVLAPPSETNDCCPLHLSLSLMSEPEHISEARFTSPELRHGSGCDGR